VILLVAATEAELCGHQGLVCGVGPVEAAAATARALGSDRPEAVLHVGLAGGAGVDVGTLVLGTEAVYADIAAAIPVISRVEPDPDLVAGAKEAVLEAVALPIATSAAVRGPCGSEPQGPFVEAMEGFAVLRACKLAGVPALEVRAVSNLLGEENRERWEIRRGLDALEAAIPRLLAALSAAGEHP
jgi:futalosine hydrolase